MHPLLKCHLYILKGTAVTGYYVKLFILLRGEPFHWMWAFSSLLKFPVEFLFISQDFNFLCCLFPLLHSGMEFTIDTISFLQIMSPSNIFKYYNKLLQWNCKNVLFEKGKSLLLSQLSRQRSDQLKKMTSGFWGTHRFVKVSRVPWRTTKELYRTTAH